MTADERRANVAYMKRLAFHYRNARKATWHHPMQNSPEAILYSLRCAADQLRRAR